MPQLWHYYMMEFCYVAISLGVVYALFFPTSPTLVKITFSLYAGEWGGAGFSLVLPRLRSLGGSR